MITKFDKSVKAQHIREQFAGCICDCDYERALDFLMQYDELKPYPEIHIARGMLYLQMTQESDDGELYSLAYHEFLMHIRRFPDCERAYRNILAVLFLRGSFPQAIAACRWIRRRGIDLEKIINELAEAGILFISPSEPADIDVLFEFGEYGEIDCEHETGVDADCNLKYSDLFELSQTDLDSKYGAKSSGLSKVELDTAEAFEKFLNGKRVISPSKVIRFASEEVDKDKIFNGKRGKPIKFVPTSDNQSVRDFRFVLEKIEKDLDDGISDERDSEVWECEIPENENALDELHKRLMQEFVFKTEDDYNDKTYGGEWDGAPDICEDFPTEYINDDIDTGDVHKMTGEEKPSKAIDVALYYFENEDYAAMYDVLDGIKGTDEDYYKRLVVLALAELDKDNYGAAERYLKKAVAINGSHPLAALLLIEIYEDTEQYKKIPPLLKGIDLTDFASVRHVHKAARLATSYCKRSDAMEIISELIEEYNILALRLIYAQMLFNSGKKEQALEEMFPLTRIYYNDINVDFINGYMRDGNGELKLTETPEAPTEVLTAVYDDLVVRLLLDRVDDGYADSDMFKRIVCGFLGLAFDFPKKVLDDMCHAVRLLTEKYATGIAVDALTDAYVDPLVKFVILSTLLEKDSNTEFLLDANFSPVSDDAVRKLEGEYCAGFMTAYAYMLVYCRRGIDDFIRLAVELNATGLCDQFDGKGITGYLVKATAKLYRHKPDDRVWRAIGFSGKTAANRAYKEICSVLKEYKGVD